MLQLRRFFFVTNRFNVSFVQLVNKIFLAFLIQECFKLSQPLRSVQSKTQQGIAVRRQVREELIDRIEETGQLQVSIRDESQPPLRFIYCLQQHIPVHEFRTGKNRNSLNSPRQSRCSFLLLTIAFFSEPIDVL